MNSASYKRPITHAAMPGIAELRPVCYHYDAGRLSYDGLCQALMDGRVQRRAGFSCRACHAVFAKFPQLRAQFDRLEP